MADRYWLLWHDDDHETTNWSGLGTYESEQDARDSADAHPDLPDGCGFVIVREVI